MMKKLRPLLVLTVGVGSLLLLLNHAGKEIVKNEEILERKSEMKVGKHQSPRFAYYTLTESCLPGYFYFESTLGNGSVCDVYINSFRMECADNNIPKNFKYVFDPLTTWATGRNMLLNASQENGRTYSYHIFFDDDAFLFHTVFWTKYCSAAGMEFGSRECLTAFLWSEDGLNQLKMKSDQQLSAYREWEADLLENSPAMAVPNYARDAEPFQSYVFQKKRYLEICNAKRDMQWITPTLFIDTMFIAYHQDALPLMLPYSTLYELTNWWTSALFQLFRAKTLLYRQVIANYRFTVLNNKHRSYPRDGVPSDMLMDYMEKENTGLADVVDLRDHAIANFDSWKQWEERLFGDPVVCTAHLKFPIGLHYRVQQQNKN